MSAGGEGFAAGRGHFLRDWQRNGEIVRKKKLFEF